MPFTLDFTLQGLVHLAFRDQGYRAVPIDSRNRDGAVALMPNVLEPKKLNIRRADGEEAFAPVHVPALHFEARHLSQRSHRWPDLFYGQPRPTRGLLVLRELDLSFEGALNRSFDLVTPRPRSTKEPRRPTDQTEHAVDWVIQLSSLQKEANPSNLKEMLVNKGVTEDPAELAREVSARCFLDHGLLGSSVRYQDGGFYPWTYQVDGEETERFTAYAIRFEMEFEEAAVLVLRHFADGSEEKLIFEPEVEGERVEVVFAHWELDATLGLDVWPRLTDTRLRAASGTFLHDVDFSLYYRLYDVEKLDERGPIGVIEAEPFRSPSGSNCGPSCC